MPEATKSPKKTVSASSSARLKKLYDEQYRQELYKELKLSNINEVPKLEKVVISVGLGKKKDDKKMFEVVNNTLLKVTGQKPVETIAKQSIASFKLREGNRIGMKVTLRDNRMYEFLDRVINLVLPRLRDFHGVSLKSFDGQGNYNLGFSDQSIFPELSFEETSNSHGMQITIVDNSNNKDHSKALLAKFGMPFEKEDK
ncbi:MAG TPA: 50S ribosomal protein L5 [Candidatus Saccharimonadales bacterium]|nr:50S ribosomal protein L5 [Candidatus Saccharimonadales bacterium]